MTPPLLAQTLRPHTEPRWQHTFSFSFFSRLSSAPTFACFQCTIFKNETAYAYSCGLRVTGYFFCHWSPVLKDSANSYIKKKDIEIKSNTCNVSVVKVVLGLKISAAVANMMRLSETLWYRQWAETFQKMQIILRLPCPSYDIIHLHHKTISGNCFGLLRPGSLPQMESACGVWWWPWCRWSPRRWWCHFCSCLSVQMPGGHAQTAAPADTHTHTHRRSSLELKSEQKNLFQWWAAWHYRGTERQNFGGWKYNYFCVGQMCGTDVTVSDTGFGNHHRPCGD